MVDTLLFVKMPSKGQGMRNPEDCMTIIIIMQSYSQCSLKKNYAKEHPKKQWCVLTGVTGFVASETSLGGAHSCRGTLTYQMIASIPQTNVK